MNAEAVGATGTGPRGSFRQRLVKGSAYAFLATVLGQLFALVTSIVYARLLGRDGLGALAVYAQLSALALAIAALGLGAPITRFVARLRFEDAGRLGRFLSTVVTLTMIASAGIAGGIAVLAGAIGEMYGVPELVPMLRILAAFMVMNSLTGVGIAILQGLQKIRRLSLVGIFLEGLGIPVIFLSLSAFGLVGAAVAGSVLSIVSLSLLFGTAWSDLRREGIPIRFHLDRESARDLATYASPLLASTFIMKIAFLVQTSILAAYLGYGDTGLFRVASVIARMLAFVSSSISVPLLPAITELYATSAEAPSRSKVTTIMRLTAYAGVPVALGIGLFAAPMIALLYGGDYAASAPLAFVLVLAGFADLLGIVAANSMLGDGKTRTLFVLDLVQVCFLVGGTTVLVMQFGLIGSGLAVLVNAMVYCGLILPLLARQRRVDLAPVLRSLLPGVGAFAVAAFAVLLANAQAHLWLGAGLVVGSAILCWRAMAPRERKLFRDVPGVLLRRGVT